MRCGVTLLVLQIKGRSDVSCSICRLPLSPSLPSAFDRAVMDKARSAMMKTSPPSMDESEGGHKRRKINDGTPSNDCSTATRPDASPEYAEIRDALLKKNPLVVSHYTKRQQWTYHMAFVEFVDWCIDEHFHLYSGKTFSSLSRAEMSQAYWDFAKFVSMSEEFVEFLFNRNQFRKLRYPAEQWALVAYHILCRGRRGELSGTAIGRSAPRSYNTRIE